MPKQAWSQKCENAFHVIGNGNAVYDTDKKLIGYANGYKARPNGQKTSYGSVCLNENVWISGNVEWDFDKKGWIYYGI